jgi:hypothetical protein
MIFGNINVCMRYKKKDEKRRNTSLLSYVLFVFFYGYCLMFDGLGGGI